MLIIGSVYLYIKALEFPMGSDRFPKFILIVIVILAGMMLINAFRGSGREKLSLKKAVGVRDILRPYALFSMYCRLYCLDAPDRFFSGNRRLGLDPHAGPGRRPAKKIYLGILTGTIVFIFFLFTYFLNVPLPKGLLFG